MIEENGNVVIWEKSGKKTISFIYLDCIKYECVCVENKTGSLYIGQVVGEWIIIFFEFFYIFCFP